MTAIIRRGSSMPWNNKHVSRWAGGTAHKHRPDLRNGFTAERQHYYNERPPETPPIDRSRDTTPLRFEYSLKQRHKNHHKKSTHHFRYVSFSYRSTRFTLSHSWLGYGVSTMTRKVSTPTFPLLFSSGRGAGIDQLHCLSSVCDKVGNHPVLRIIVIARRRPQLSAFLLLLCAKCKAASLCTNKSRSSKFSHSARSSMVMCGYGASPWHWTPKTSPDPVYLYEHHRALAMTSLEVGRAAVFVCRITHAHGIRLRIQPNGNVYSRNRRVCKGCST